MQRRDGILRSRGHVSIRVCSFVFWLYVNSTFLSTDFRAVLGYSKLSLLIPFFANMLNEYFKTVMSKIVVTDNKRTIAVVVFNLKSFGEQGISR